MTMTKTEWSQCVIVLRAVYPGFQRLDVDAVCVWFDLLKDLPGDAVLSAVRQMAQTQPAYPSIADIRKLADANRPPAENPYEDKPWGSIYANAGMPATPVGWMNLAASVGRD